MRQSTCRICRHCNVRGDEYGVIYGEPTAADRMRGHDPQAQRDMDAHEAMCEQNPHRDPYYNSLVSKIGRFIRS